MGHIIVDFDVYPLIQITLPPELDAEAVRAMYRDLEEVRRRPGHYVTMVDTRALPRMPDAVARRALADGGESIGEHAQQFSLGTALIVQSELVRRALTAFNWIRHDRFKLPEVYVSNEAEACAWSVRQLDSKGATTATVRAFVRRFPAVE